MPAFEYTTEVMSHGFMGVHKGELKRSEFERLLNARGAEGWDLVHVWFDQKMQGEKDGHLLIFRRTLGEPRAAAANVFTEPAGRPQEQPKPAIWPPPPTPRGP